MTPYEKLLNSIPPYVLEKCVHDIISNKDNQEYDIGNYKGFAGWSVKYQMLRYAINHFNKEGHNVSFLLDLASGRGNDLQKWTKIYQESKEENLKRIVGVEYSRSQVKEAISRYNSLKAGARKRRTKIPKVSYVLGSAYDTQLINKWVKEKIELITCNFAIHYFFETEEICNTFFKIISDKLKVGGLFLGTAPDGDVIDSIFKLICNKKDENCEVRTNLYYIKKGSNFDLNSIKFGRDYLFALQTPYFEEEASLEYLVKKNHILSMAKKYDLIPYAVIPNVSAISNLAYFPLTKMEVGKKEDKIRNKYVHQRPLGIASLFFGFSFIKAGKKLLNNIDNPKGVVIVPYRNREEQLVQLLINLSSELDVIVVEQKNEEPFNRGLLLNLGVKTALESKSKHYNYFILHDVDLIPDEELKFYYLKYPVNPIHLGARGQRYSEVEDISKGTLMKEKHFLGGVLSINKDDFLKVNGYSFQKFKGWGGEDDSFRNRLLNKGIVYVKPPDGEVYDLEEMDIETKMKKLREEKAKIPGNKKRKLIEQDFKDYHRDGIKQIKESMYKVSKKGEYIDMLKEINRKNVSWIIQGN